MVIFDECNLDKEMVSRNIITTSDKFEWLFSTTHWVLGPVSRKFRELYGPEKPFLKLRPAHSVKLVVLYVVKGIKIKITAKFRASIRLRFEDTKRIMSPEIRPKTFGTFEKRAPEVETKEVFMVSVFFFILRSMALIFLIFSVL